MIRTVDAKLIMRPNDTNELFDLVEDPRETMNRFDDPGYAAIWSGLERRLLEWFIRTDDVIPWDDDPRGFPE